MEYAKKESHVVKCEYNSSCIETRGTDSYWNKSKYKTSNVCNQHDYVKQIPEIRRIADELKFRRWRVIHCDLHNNTFMNHNKFGKPVQFNEFVYHNLCDRNKLLYKRCAKSVRRPKFRPPQLPHFSTNLMKLR